MVSEAGYNFCSSWQIFSYPSTINWKSILFFPNCSTTSVAYDWICFLAVSGLPFPSSGNLPDPGIEHASLALAGLFTTAPEEALKGTRYINKQVHYDHGFENSILKMSILPKLTYGFQAVLTENCCCCCYCWVFGVNSKVSWSVKSNHFLREKEYDCCELVLTEIKTPYKAIK